MHVARYHGLGSLPFFNPDCDREPLPEGVADFRARVGQADGLLLCSPEYARGVSGVMKNALDWLVGSLAFPGKPVALINASQRATDADAHLRLTLRTMNARLVDAASITVPLLGVTLEPARLVADPALLNAIVTALAAFRTAILNAA